MFFIHLNINEKKGEKERKNKNTILFYKIMILALIDIDSNFVSVYSTMIEN